MTTEHCPDLATLQDFSVGRLGPSDWEKVAEHVVECPTCLDLLDTLHDQDEPLDSLARIAKNRLAMLEDHGCQQAVKRYQQVVLEGKPSRGKVSESRVGTRTQPTLLSNSSDSQETVVFTQLGPYWIEEAIGRGGMGHVYRARHTKLDKPVALKVLQLKSLDSRELIDRFQREMKATGRLEHPNLVRAIDAGEEAGVHYLTMELIEGSDLAAVVRDRGPLPVHRACEIIRQAALGLHFIHEQGLVHRDVKPSNIMLTGDGHVKILDLGLALFTEIHESDLTGLGQMMGTLGYMAPEQASDSHHVDWRTDIYSLGCTLFFLLAGHEPYPLPKPASPLKYAMAHAHAPIPDITEDRSDVPAPLADFLRRCLAKDPAERPQTALDMAETLGTFTDENAPQNIEDTLAENQGDSQSPKRRGVIGILVLLGALAGLIFLSALLISIRSKNGTLYLELSGVKARDVQVKVNEQYVEVVPMRDGRSLKLSVPAGKHDLVVEYEGLALKTEQNRFEIAAGKQRTIRAWYEPKPPSREMPPKTFQQESREPKPARAADPLWKGGIAFEDMERDQIPSAELALLGGGDPDNAPEELVGMIGQTGFKQVDAIKLAYSRDGRQLASLSKDGIAVVCDADTGMPIRTIATPGPSDWCQINDIEFTADGHRLMTLTKSPRLWRIADGKHLNVYVNRSRCMALSHDSNLLGYSHGLGNLVVADLATGKPVFSCRPHHTLPNAMALSEDAQLIAAGYNDGTICLWSRKRDQELYRFDAKPGVIVDLALSPDDQRLASCAIKDRTIFVWDVPTGKLVRALKGEHPYMRGVGFSPDGAILAASAASRLQLWQTDTWRQTVYRAESCIGDFEFSPDGSQLAYTDRGGIAIIDTKTKRKLKNPISNEVITNIRLKENGEIWLSSWLAKSQREIIVRTFGDSPSPQFRHRVVGLSVDDPKFHSRVLDSGNRVAAVYDQHLRVWDVETGQELYAHSWDMAKHVTAALEPGGQKLAIGHMDGTLKVIDLATDEEFGPVPGHDETITQIVFASLDTLISTDGKSVKVWNASLTQPPITMAERPVKALAVSEDGDFLCFAQGPAEESLTGGPYEVGIYELATGKCVGKFQTEFFPEASGVSPNGRLVAASARDGRLIVWDADSQKRLHEWTLPFSCRPVFLPDGRHLVTINNNGTAYVFRLSHVSSQ